MVAELKTTALPESFLPQREAPQSFWRMTWRRFRRHTMALVGASLLALMILIIAAAPLTARYSPTDQSLRARYQAPSWEHWMGTDELGRDMWARVIYGGQISLMVGLLSMGVAVSIGTLVGLGAGYYGGWTDNLLMRLTDVFLTIPRLFALLILVTYLRDADIPGMQAGSVGPIALVIASLSWMGVARLVRASTLEQRGRDYVLASRALGAPDRRIIFQHILPNVASPIIVAATLGLAGAIITESGLSYLGFGIQPPTPTWGNMLSNAQSQMTTAPWTAIFPGLMIFLVVLTINSLGDGLRDALDPRHVKGDKAG